jgi:hypothetical protein
MERFKETPQTETPENLNSESENPFEELRSRTHVDMERELQKRLKETPTPTDYEVKLGTFEEELEPQMRGVIRKLWEKGYASESSGFGGYDGREYQQLDGLFEIDEATEKKLGEIGVEVRRREDEYMNARTTWVEFEPESPDLEAITRKWGLIAEILPPIGEQSYSLSLASAEFRQKYLGDNEATRIQCETALKRKLYSPEERSQAEQWLREHPKK